MISPQLADLPVNPRHQKKVQKGVDNMNEQYCFACFVHYSAGCWIERYNVHRSDTAAFHRPEGCMVQIQSIACVENTACMSWSTARWSGVQMDFVKHFPMHHSYAFLF